MLRGDTHRTSLDEWLAAQGLSAARLCDLADVAWVQRPWEPGACFVSPGYARLWERPSDGLGADGDAWLEAVLPAWRDDARRALAESFGVDATFPAACGAGVRWFRGRRVRLGEGAGAVLLADVTAERAGAQQARAAREAAERELASGERALREAVEGFGRERASRESAQRALLRAEKLEVLGRLTPGLAHDFNNVLSVVSGAMFLLEDDLTDPRHLALLERGQRAVQAGAELVRGLTAFAGERGAGRRPVDPNRAVEACRGLAQVALGARVRLTVRLQATRWAAVDPQQLQMALLNLAINARDAMPEGGALEVATEDHALGVALTVRDEGCGMTPEDLARATDPFYTTKAPGRGTGLGLAMVREFAETSGGTLELESAVGVGTTARIVVPAVEAEPVDADATRQRIDRRRHGGATVLLVEDDPAVRAMTAARVRDLGYGVLEAGTAAEAMVLAEASPRLDLLLVDLELPDLDGARLAVRLRAARPGLAVLYVSGHPVTERVAGSAVLRKPFEPAELAARILAALRRGDDDADDAIEDAVAHPALRAFFSAWRALRRAGDVSLDAVLPCVAAARGIAVVARVTSRDPVACAIEHVGEGLVAQFASHPGAEDEVAGAVRAVYEGCAARGAPTYEAVRLRLGPTPPARIERVIVPCLDRATGEVTHLVALVALEDIAPPHSPEVHLG